MPKKFDYDGAGQFSTVDARSEAKPKTAHIAPAHAEARGEAPLKEHVAASPKASSGKMGQMGRATGS